MKALLITDNTSKFNQFRKCFESNFSSFTLDTTGTEKEAINYVTENDNLAFFIVDAGHKKEITKILNTIMDISGHRPVVICGDDKDLSRINKGLILKNEGNCLLKDVNDVVKIKKIISSAIKWNRQKTQASQNEGALEDVPENFIPIKVRNLLFYDKFPNNLYTKISETKYVIAVEKNTEISDFQVKQFMKRKVQYLYVERDRHLEFLHKSINNALKFFEKHKDLNRRTVMAHLRCCAILHDYLINIGNTEELNKFIEAYVDHITLVLGKTFNIEKLCKSFNFKITSIVSRSLLSAYFSFYILREMGWRSRIVQRKFIFASLIQDALIENDELARLKNLADPRVINFTEAEIEAYPEHPRKIAEIARQFTQFPDIDFLLEQQHELPTRDGFPKCPHPNEMQLAVCIFNLASNFACDIDGKEMSLSRIKTVYRIQYSTIFNVGKFKEPVAKLKKIVQVA